VLLLGVVSYRELLRRSLESPVAAATDTVADLMGSSPPTIEPSAPLALAAERIVEWHVACLPVVEPVPAGPSIVGLVTEADLLRTAYESFAAPAGA
jgi:CBS domain-containing protein